MALREARDKIFHGYWQDALEGDLRRISSWGSDGYGLRLASLSPVGPVLRLTSLTTLGFRQIQEGL
jgi:hypothetical protein